MALPESSAVEAEAAAHLGFIDYYGYHAPSGGWCFIGWIAAAAARQRLANVNLTATFQLGAIDGSPISAGFTRSDLQGAGIGIVFYLPGPGRYQGPLAALELVSESYSVTLPSASSAPQYTGGDLIRHVQSVLAASTEPTRLRILTLLSRKGYAGHDTLATLGVPIFMDFDAAILCPPDGLVLMGWLLAKPGTLQTIRLRSGDTVCEIRPADFVPISRLDVVEAVGRAHGLTRENNGFIAFAPHGFAPSEASYLEIETTSGEIAYKNFPAPQLTGLAAIRRILDAFEAQYTAIDRAFDKVIGPCIARLNDERLAATVEIDRLTFGTPPPAPRHSIIVPLYGRIDFMEVQLGLFAAHPACADFELIYVLDDPPRRAALEILAESIYERFRLPITILLLDTNAGFAAASNIGLHYARGDFICFLNSDVFPGTPDWMERLAARLDADPKIGCIGPLLLYEDDSIQHIGMEFAPLPQFGNWFFPLHARKGRRPPTDQAVLPCHAITGAAMVMRRGIAVALGGFDEAYVIGDFEDADLCLKVNTAGLRCAVDTGVRLYHLERKSQAGSANRWRLNMTLYNAWRHQRRWRTELAAIARPTPGGEASPPHG